MGSASARLDRLYANRNFDCACANRNSIFYCDALPTWIRCIHTLEIHRAHAIRDMLNFARDMAITERTSYLVVFDLTANRYWLASSETFDLAGPSTPVTTNSVSVQSSQPTADQGATALQGTHPSRTNAILGIPQKPGHNVSLARMITNHNSQTIQIDSGVDYVYFSPTGSSEDTVLYFQDQRGQVMSITVENATGRIRLQKINSQQLEQLGLAHESSE